MNLKCIITIVSIASSSAATAGPDAASFYLITEPASLLDLGISKLQSQLRNSSYFDDMDVHFFVTYDFDNDEIFIQGRHSAASLEEAESVCDDWFSFVRIAALVDEDGTPFLETSAFSGHFTHLGYRGKNEPENLEQQIDKKFSLNCTSTTKDGNSFTATGMLLEEGYSIRK